MATEAFDYIIVGSGAGGGPLACNLAKAGYRVLLMEAGGDHAKAREGAEECKLAYDMPLMSGHASEDPNMSWSYFVDHFSDPNRNRRCHNFQPDWGGIFYPRAGTLGGCTSHYAMIMITAHDSDWDGIAELTGDSSWAAKKMRPYLNRVERWLRLRAPGIGVLLEALKDKEQAEIHKSAMKAAGVDRGLLDRSLGKVLRLLGTPNRRNLAGQPKTGVFRIPAAASGIRGFGRRRGQRGGTREYIFQTIQKTNGRLTLWTEKLVTRILLENGAPPRAVGVEFMSGAGLYRASAKAVDEAKAKAAYDQRKTVRVRPGGEVILCAGAFNTPQILNLSGIGDPEQLEAAGVDCRVDLPGVGRNLQDRYEVGVVSEAEKDFTLYQNGWPSIPPIPDDPNFEKWSRNGGGLYGTNGAALTTIMRSKSGGPNGDPDLFVFGIPGQFSGYFPGYAKALLEHRNRFTWVILKGHTENTGQVSLRSSIPWERPEISFNYFGDGKRLDDRDRNALVEAVKYVRSINENVPPGILKRELVPGPKADLNEFVTYGSWGHHASCSCKIGADDDPSAVLDSKFRVRKTQGLRVVDACVFPKIPGLFVALPIFMISEKASDTILADARQN